MTGLSFALAKGFVAIVWKAEEGAATGEQYRKPGVHGERG